MEIKDLHHPKWGRPFIVRHLKLDAFVLPGGEVVRTPAAAIVKFRQMALAAGYREVRNVQAA